MNTKKYKKLESNSLDLLASGIKYPSNIKWSSSSEDILTRAIKLWKDASPKKRNY